MTIGVGTTVATAGGWGVILSARDNAVGEAQSEFNARFTDITDPVERSAMWDAYRHTYVSARLVQVGYESVFVNMLGTIREIPQLATSPLDANMDLYNNALGRSLGTASADQPALAADVEAAIRDELAIVYKDTDPRLHEGEDPPLSMSDIEDLEGAPPILSDDPDEPFTPPRKPLVPGWISPDVAVPFNNSKSLASPIIIDLDNDGVEAAQFNASTTTTFFDIDNDGFREQTAWIGDDDGLLVRDLNSNGQIDDASELFGSATADGFAILSALDSNGDHVIDANDADFTDLMIWKDVNEDAYVQSGELQSLSYWNIQSISLAGIAASTGTINGNPVSHTSTVTLSSGATRAAADVWFVHDNVNSFYDADYELDIRTLFLPNLRGFGELPDLHIAMSLNEDLLDLVAELNVNWSFENFADPEGLSETIEEILFTWAGVESVDPNARSSSALDGVDTRHLEFIEKFLGDKFILLGIPGAIIPDPQGWYVIAEIWQSIEARLGSQLLYQAGGSGLYDDAAVYSPFSGAFEGDITLSEDAINDLISLSTATGVDTEAYWRSVAQFIDNTMGIGNLSGTEEGWLDDAIYNADPGLTWDDVKTAYMPTGTTYYGTSGGDTVTGTYLADTLYGDGGNDIINGDAGNDLIFGGADNDTLYGGTGNDEIDGGSGNDTLDGGAGGNILRGQDGNDSYIYQGGSDVIFEYGGTDVIYLPSGITLSDVTLSRVNNDSGGSLLISFSAGGNILVNNQFYYYSSLPFVETIDFYDPLDGTIDLTTLDNIVTHGTSGNDYIAGITNPTQLNDIIYGYEGADSIYAGGGNDILDGGLGNDVLYGQGGDDTYIASYGFDEYYDDTGSNDIIIIPEEFSVSDVSFVRSAAVGQDHIMVMVQGLGQLKLSYQFYGSGGTIEKISFANGIDADITLSSISYDLLGTEGDDSLSGLTSLGAPDEYIYGYGGNDTLIGNNGNDVLDGGAGNDTLYGESGDDTFVISAGNDGIRDSGGDDTFLIPEAYGVSDLVFYRLSSDYSDHVHITVTGLGDVTIFDQLAYYVIENITFANGIDSDISLSSVSYTVFGTSGNDNLYGANSGADPDEQFYGYAGNDYFAAGSGNDRLYGGDGLDTMTGGSGDDIFVFEAASAFNNIDVITDFNVSDDAIDLRDVLSLFDPLTDLITDFVEISNSSYYDSILKVDRDGTGSTYGFEQVASLYNVNGITDEAALVTNGNLLVA